MQQPLMLPSAHSAVLVPAKENLFVRYHNLFFVLGILVVLLGLLDLGNRLPAHIPNSAVQTAFAPAATLNY